MPRDALRGSQEEIASWSQRVVQERDQLALQIGVEVDQHVPASDQIDPREGRIADQIMRRKDAHIADRFGDLIETPILDEEARQLLAGNMLDDALVVPALPGYLQRVLVNVGREHLHRRWRLK